MPKSRLDERYMHDLQHVYTALVDVLVPRGLYAESAVLLVVNHRRPALLHDVALELVIRAWRGGAPVWRASETLRVPGRMKLRSVATVLCGLMLRATYEVEASVNPPGHLPA